MNHFAAYIQGVPNGYRVMVRFAQHGRPNPVLNKGGTPIIFRTELEATQQALKHVLAYFNGDYLRHGETASSAKSEAEKLFPDLKPIRKNGKIVHVERKRRAA